MQLLLDTRVFIWAGAMVERLNLVARRAIEDSANEVYVSSAVAWEIAIKYSVGKISLPAPPQSWVPARISALGFKPLPITPEHALATLSLPKRHNDPFDRMLVAQAQLEGLTLVTHDRRILAYAVHAMKA